MKRIWLKVISAKDIPAKPGVKKIL